MKTERLAVRVLICMLPLLPLGAAGDGFQITGLTGNGILTWQDTFTNGHFTVEWSSDLSLPWCSDWSSLSQIASTGGTVTARVPMFFRVVHRPAQSPSANMVLVAGGGQVGGPQYDLYVSKYEVTEQEFINFLNDAEANPGNARGSYTYFDINGDVYMDSSTTASEMMFDISDSNLIYSKNNSVGSRYSGFQDSANNPITGVSWYGALKYCNWLTVSQARGEGARCFSEGVSTADWRPVNTTQAEWSDGFDNSERFDLAQNYAGFRLPMTGYGTGVAYFNEYYKAAAWNGSDNTTYGFGRNSLTKPDANYEGSDDPYDLFTIETTPVGFYDGGLHSGFQTASNMNQYGIFDLSGNVKEWSLDSPVSGSTSERVLCGGSWYQGNSTVNGYPYLGCQTPNLSPFKSSPQETRTYIGFRVVSTEP